MPTLITPDSPLSLEQVSVDTWVRFARSRPLQLGQFSTIANTQAQMVWAALGMNLLKAHRKLKRMELAGSGAS